MTIITLDRRTLVGQEETVAPDRVCSSGRRLRMPKRTFTGGIVQQNALP
ncbi:hypothetical protein KZJ38_16845 [Paraburkholderia edwinii]|uniref:Uncharacterized protein n=1 Tax=Paraburkholderia edwinii TaxID=2861782 RepID=A0ABX8UHZ1_9BURK|nr:hypothetical protein [Paraburkholderia edwinii]QYD67957.1 hypothetical protein KZJ38_16845 [Paraburkholderia edwinii]